jgi:hypothetical protein
MSLDGQYVGNYGYPIRLTCTEDGAAANVSAFGTVQYLFRDPAGAVTVGTAAFYTDGSDGVLTYTVGSALLTSAGDWQVQAKLTKSGETVYSERLDFSVGRVLA